MAKANMSLTRNAMPVQDALVRAHNFDEVALGYTEEQAIDEANRCLNCKNMPCVDGPDFNGYEIDFDEAMARGRMYSGFERHKHEETCNLFAKEVQ